MTDPTAPDPTTPPAPAPGTGGGSPVAPADVDDTPGGSTSTATGDTASGHTATAHTATDGVADDADAPGAGHRFVFVDTEATGLDHDRHELTEVSWVVRFEDGSQVERTYYPEHTLDGATEEALQLTQYHQRIADQPRTPMAEWLGQFLEDARGAALVGAVPDFDARHLHKACRKLGLEPTWDHHLLDVETLALPLIAPGPEIPRSLARTCAALGIEHDRSQAHGALYDAQQAMRVFDRVWEVVAAARADGGQLPPPVPRRTAGTGDAPDAAAADTGPDTSPDDVDGGAAVGDLQA